MAIPRTERQPNGRYRGVATVGGRRICRSFDTEGEAFVWADREMRQAQARETSAAETLAERKVPTLAEFEPVWLGSLNIEQSTQATYRSWLRPSVERFGDRPLQDDQFDPLELSTFFASMSRGSGKNYRSPTTVKDRIKALRMLFASARSAKYMTIDPTEGIRLPKIPKLPHRVIEWEEEDALLEAAVHEGCLEAVLLGLDAGLRWEEVYGLHVANANLLRHRLDVTDTLVRPDFQPRPYPKGKKTRPIPLTGRLERALEAYLDAGAGLIRCPDRRCPSGGWLMFSHDRRPVNYHQWKASFQRAVQAAGLREPAPTFHKLRHTFGTRLASAGTPVREIADLMGHESTETAEGYVQAAGPQVREAWLRFALEGGVSPLQTLMDRRAPGAAAV